MHSDAVRDLLVILGDQLDRQSPLFQGADPAVDRIWMAEVASESTYVWSHKARIALFLSAMRHFRDELRAQGWTVEYRKIDSQPTTLAAEPERAIGRLQPQRVRLVETGEYRLTRELQQLAVDMVPDPHFLATAEDFRDFARRHKQLRIDVEVSRHITSSETDHQPQ